MTVLPRVQGDYGFKGFFNIRDPQALFEKMRYDYGRMIGEPLNGSDVSARKAHAQETRRERPERA
jgi:hypothetical protein